MSSLHLSVCSFVRYCAHFGSLGCHLVSCGALLGFILAQHRPKSHLDTLLFSKTLIFKNHCQNQRKTHFLDPRWVPRSAQDGAKIALRGAVFDFWVGAPPPARIWMDFIFLFFGSTRSWEIQRPSGNSVPCALHKGYSLTKCLGGMILHFKIPNGEYNLKL